MKKFIFTIITIGLVFLFSVICFYHQSSRIDGLQSELDSHSIYKHGDLKKYIDDRDNGKEALSSSRDGDIWRYLCEIMLTKEHINTFIDTYKSRCMTYDQVIELERCLCNNCNKKFESYNNQLITCILKSKEN